MQALFSLDEVQAFKPHPARYTPALLPVMARMLRGCRRILDPMAGTGGVRKLAAWLPGAEFYLNELEPEWAEEARAHCGDARSLSWPAGYFDGLCVSPPYGNRLRDGFLPSDEDGSYTRFGYAASLRRALSAGSTASKAFRAGGEYCTGQEEIWQECTRVLAPGGRFVLNVKDYTEAGSVQPVTAWHVETLQALGYTLEERIDVPCPGFRWGQNAEKRASTEAVILFCRAL